MELSIRFTVYVQNKNRVHDITGGVGQPEFENDSRILK